MADLEMRLATPDERRRCASQWVRSLTRVSEGKDGVRWLRCGRGECTAPFMSDSLLQSVTRLCHRGVVQVAVIPAIDEPLGFVCWEPETEQEVRRIHFVHVTGPARRKGVGTALLSSVATELYQPTFMTHAGKALEEHVLRKAVRKTT